MKQLGFLLTIFVLFFACNNAPQNENEPTKTPEPEAYQLPAAAKSLYDIVCEKHDTAMKLDKTIENLQFQLRKHIDDNSKLKAVEEQCLELLTPLRSAQKGMNTWMADFKGIDLHMDFYEGKSEGEIMQYLQAEETAIELVHQKMIESTQKAQTYLKEHKKE